MTRLPKHIRRRINFLTSAWQTSLTACHYNVFTFPFYFVRCIHLYFQHGFTPQETLHLNLHHLKTSISDSYISKKYLLRLQQALNHPSLQCLTEEKSLFYLHCMQLGIPIPRLFGIFCSSSTGLQIGTGPLYGEDQWIKFFDIHCPLRFVVKPSNGVYGNDILFIDKTDPSFSSASLYHQLTHNIRYSSFVIQERLENHPDLQHINPKMGLQTFRVITLTISPDDIAILYAFFKPITGDNLIDNHRGGETLNLRKRALIPTFPRAC